MRTTAPPLAAAALALLACAPIAGAGLVAHWPLDTDASDATGNGFDGAVVGGTVTFGEPGAAMATGSAASFPDTGHIDIPYSADLFKGTQGPGGAESFTIALWCNPTDLTGHNSPFTGREDTGTVHGPIIYNTPGNVWSYWAGNAGGSGAWNPIDSAASATIGTWQHIAVTYDATTTTRKMFVDGAEVASAQVGVSPNGQRDFHIGSGQDDGLNFYWSGLIDDVGVWDVNLTEAEIASAIANGVPGALPDPRAQVPGGLTVVTGADSTTIDVEITNGGEANTLTILDYEVSNDTNFGLSGNSGSILPGMTGFASVEFFANGGTGTFQTDLFIDTDDPINSTVTVPITVIVRDPEIATAGELDFGVLPVGTLGADASLTVENLGAAADLEISAVTVTGTNAAQFTIDSFPAAIAAGGTGDIEVSFDPAGIDGGFSAQLEIASNDIVTPVVTVPISATVTVPEPLVAWWPLDTDSTDASGNGFDGVDQGAITYAQPGANAATGGSAAFTGAEHIDIPWAEDLNTRSFSITLWAYPTAAGGGGGFYRSPVTNRDDVAPGGAFRHGWILYNTNGGAWSFWNGGGTGAMGGWNGLNGPAVIVDEWHHLALTYDAASNTKTMYVDGSAVATQNPVAFSPNNGDAPTADPGYTYENEDLHIGGGGDTGTSFRWEGRLDDVGLFRTALTQEEIAEIMTAGVASQANSAPFAITDITRDSATQATISWNARPGSLYAVWRAIGGLGADDWQELDDSVLAESEDATYTDATIPAGATEAHYRVSLPE